MSETFFHPDDPLFPSSDPGKVPRLLSIRPAVLRPGVRTVLGISGVHLEQAQVEVDGAEVVVLEEEVLDSARARQEVLPRKAGVLYVHLTGTREVLGVPSVQGDLRSELMELKADSAAREYERFTQRLVAREPRAAHQALCLSLAAISRARESAGRASASDRSADGSRRAAAVARVLERMKSDLENMIARSEPSHGQIVPIPPPPTRR